MPRFNLQMMHRALLAAALVSLAGCSKVEEWRFKRAAVAELEDLLHDPDSAKFSDLTVRREDEFTYVLCGRVNAKNLMGGYTGRTPFLVRGMSGLDDFIFLERSFRPTSTLGEESQVRANTFDSDYRRHCQQDIGPE